MKLWIARDKFSECTVAFEEKPTWNGTDWVLNNEVGWAVGTFHVNIFPNLTFENSPQKINLLTNDQIIDIRNEGYDIGWISQKE